MSNNDSDPTLVAGFGPGGPVHRCQNTLDGPRYLSREEAFRVQEQERIGWAHYVAMQDQREQARRDVERREQARRDVESAYYQKAWQLEAEAKQEEQEWRKMIWEKFAQIVGDLYHRKKIPLGGAMALYHLLWEVLPRNRAVSNKTRLGIYNFLNDLSKLAEVINKRT